MTYSVVPREDAAQEKETIREGEDQMASKKEIRYANISAPQPMLRDYERPSYISIMLY